MKRKVGGQPKPPSDDPVVNKKRAKDVRYYQANRLRILERKARSAVPTSPRPPAPERGELRWVPARPLQAYSNEYIP